MDKTITYRGKSKTNLQLREALELFQSFAQALGDGKTEFSLEYSKKDGASVMKVATVAAGPVVEVSKAMVDK